VVVGGGVVWSRWRAAPDADPLVGLLGPAWSWCASGFGVDTVYDRVVIAPVKALARGVVVVDDDLGAGVHGIGSATTRAALDLRRFQVGDPQSYLTGALAGVGVLLVVAALVVWV
jgi:NADH-quinone oxidoreductase subunit L